MILASTLVTAMAAFTLAQPASPARADAWGVSNEAELRSALSAVPAGVIHLDADFSVTSEGLTITSDTTLDLAGHELKTMSIVVNPGVTLTVGVPGGSGILDIDSATGPGITTTGAALIINNGTVTVASHFGHAGIGGAEGLGHGGDGQPGGMTIINGGVVRVFGGGAGIGGGRGATNPTGEGGDGGNGGMTRVNGGTLEAYGSWGAGIGGGNGGAGSSGRGGNGGVAGFTAFASATVDAFSLRAAGIGGGSGGLSDSQLGGLGGSGGSVEIVGATVTAVSDGRGAGVGGGAGGDSLVHAGGRGGDGGQVDVLSGSLTAIGKNGAGIGGGDGGVSARPDPVPDGRPGESGRVHIGATATVAAERDAASRREAVAIGPGIGSFTPPWGGIHLDGQLTLPPGQQLNVAISGASSLLSGTGRITGGGTIDNLGAITPFVDDSVTVTGNDFRVTFDSGSSHASPSSQVVRVLAPSFVAGARSFPTDPTIPGNTFTEWNTQPDGSGAVVSESTTLTRSVTFFGQWQFENYEMTADVTSPVVGETITFSISAETDASTDVSAEFDFSTDHPAAQITGNRIIFGKPGNWTVTATHAVSGVQVSLPVTVVIDRTAPVTIKLNLSSTAVDVDGTVSFDVTGVDAYGNSLGDLTDLATVTSDQPADAIDPAGSIHFRTPGSHRLTARIGSAVDRVDVTVIPESYTLTADVAGPLAGDTITFAVTADDGDPVGNLASEFTFTAATAGDNATGNPVTLTTAGDWVITATHSVSGTQVKLPITVGTDRTTPTTITLQLSAARVNVGGTIAATVTGTDAWGNPLGNLTDLATITSDNPNDVIGADGSIRFPTASEHVITATIGSVSHSATVTVVPAASPAGLATTGSDPRALAMTAALLTLLGTFWVALRRRRRN